MVSGLSQRVQLLIPSGQSPLAAGRRVGPSDHRGRGKRHRAVGACVAQDTADTVYQSAVELNRSRDM